MFLELKLEQFMPTLALELKVDENTTIFALFIATMIIHAVVILPLSLIFKLNLSALLHH